MSGRRYEINANKGLRTKHFQPAAVQSAENAECDSLSGGPY
jgi:hypothetical protein